MENTEKQEDVIQEVKTEEKPVEQQEPTKEKISYTEVKEDGTIKVDLSKLKQFQEEKENKDESVKESKTSDEEQTGIDKAVNKEEVIECCNCDEID